MIYDRYSIFFCNWSYRKNYSSSILLLQLVLPEQSFFFYSSSAIDLTGKIILLLFFFPNWSYWNNHSSSILLLQLVLLEQLFLFCNTLIDFKNFDYSLNNKIIYLNIQFWVLFNNWKEKKNSFKKSSWNEGHRRIKMIYAAKIKLQKMLMLWYFTFIL